MKNSGAEPTGSSPLRMTPRADRGPIELQDHGHRVRFRNIWLRELPERARAPADYLAERKIISLSADVLDPLTGQYAMGQQKGLEAGHDQSRRRTPAFQNGFAAQAARHASRIPPTEFVLPHADARFTFQRDEQGQVTGVLFRVGDGEQLLTRIP